MEATAHARERTSPHQTHPKEPDTKILSHSHTHPRARTHSPTHSLVCERNQFTHFTIVCPLKSFQAGKNKIDFYLGEYKGQHMGRITLDQFPMSHADWMKFPFVWTGTKDNRG